MHEPHPTRDFPGAGKDLPGREHRFQIGRSIDIVVDPVSVLLFQMGVEEGKTAGHHHCPAVYRRPVGEPDGKLARTPIHLQDRHPGTHFHPGDSIAQVPQYVGRMTPLGEQAVPRRYIAAQLVFLLDQVYSVTFPCQGRRRRHSGHPAPDYDHILHVLRLQSVILFLSPPSADISWLRPPFSRTLSSSFAFSPPSLTPFSRPQPGLSHFSRTPVPHRLTGRSRTLSSKWAPRDAPGLFLPAL